MNQILDVKKFARSIFEPREKLSIPEWAEKNLTLSARVTNIPGAYSTKLTPYVKEPLEAFGDDSIRRITLVWGSQTSKTTTILAGLAYRLSERPCPALWVMPTEALARSFSETRWLPMIDDCPALAKEKPDNTDKIKILEQHFRRMSLWFVGSNSPANLASRSVSLLMLDEVDKYPDAGSTKSEAGALQLAEARVATYPNHLIIATSTPTTADSTIWAEWQKGDMRFFFVPCPYCNHKQKLIWGQVKWDEAAKSEEAVYDFKLVKSSAYYECENCKGKITDGQKTAMLRGGEWTPTNPKGEPNRRSYHLNGLYAPWVTFGSLAVKFLQDKYSGIIGLQDFVNRILAEPWLEHEQERIEIKAGGYKMGQVHDGEKSVMAVDVQESGGFHTWAVVRAYDADGKSRMVWAGRLETWGDVAAKADEFRVEPKYVFVDSGDQTRAVYEMCCRNGWIALVGSDKSSFSEIVNNEKVTRPFARIANGDPFSGKASGSRVGWKWRLCPVWRWSNPAIKDILANLLTGEGFVADDAPTVWYEHIRAEQKVAVKNPMTGRTRFVWKQIGKQNHLMDCECMNIVGAGLHKLLQVSPAGLTESEFDNGEG
jgi:phage terminase large subunit GpA-like protein